MWFCKKEKKGSVLTLQTLLSAPDDSVDNESFINDPDYTGGVAIIPYENIIDRNYGSAKRQMRELFYEAYHNDNLTYEKKYNLFQFTSFDPKYTPQNILNSVIILNQPQSFNDPLDPIIRPWLKLYRKAIKNKAVHTLAGNAEKALEHYRIRCFAYEKGLKCGDGNTMFLPTEQNVEAINPLMWAHYADGHKGICLKCQIDMEELKHQYDTKDSYIQLRPVKYVNKIDIHQPISLSEALVIKGNYWEYEHEIRLIYYSLQKQEEHFPIKVNITDIYLGVLCPENVCQCIRENLRNSKTKLHKMSFSPDDVTKLKVIDLN